MSWNFTVQRGFYDSHILTFLNNMIMDNIKLITNICEMPLANLFWKDIFWPILKAYYPLKYQKIGWNFKDFISIYPSSRCLLEKCERKDKSWCEYSGNCLNMVPGHLHIINDNIPG